MVELRKWSKFLCQSNKIICSKLTLTMLLDFWGAGCFMLNSLAIQPYAAGTHEQKNTQSSVQIYTYSKCKHTSVVENHVTLNLCFLCAW